MRSQKGAVGKILGGWQVDGFLTLQSGAPFTVLNSSDPGGIVTGNLVGTSIRPFLNTNLDLSSLTVRQVQAAGGGSPRGCPTMEGHALAILRQRCAIARDFAILLVSWKTAISGSPTQFNSPLP